MQASAAYAGSDRYASSGGLDYGAPQARWRRLEVTGPLPEERGRLAGLPHIVWIPRMPAAPHVLAARG